jgi:hypothetical protein
MGSAADQRAVLGVDGALAIEVVIMLRDFQHSLARHILPAQHVLEERDHLVVALRASE